MKTAPEAFTFTCGLVFGTACTIMSKLLFDTVVDGKKFEKPLFQTFLMFVGMLLGLPMHFLIQRMQRTTAPEDYQPLGDEIQVKKPVLTRRMFFFLIVPAVFDLLGTALCMVGLVSVDVSLYQLLKCSVIIFVALAKRLILGIKLESHLWVGVVIIFVAVSVAASSSLFEETSSEDDPSSAQKSSPIVGMGLIFLSCIVQSLQYIFEEKVMGDGEISVPPLIVIGMEGFWGLLISVFVVLPIAGTIPGNDCRGLCGNATGVYEDTWDSFHMMSQSSSLVVFLVFYVLVITGYNTSCVFVTYLLDAVWHAILDNFRPISVWIVDLLIHIVFGSGYGEQWTNYSWIQLGGLILLLYGTAVYNGNVHVPYIKYTDVRRTPLTGGLTRSPMLTRNSNIPNKPDAGARSESEHEASRQRLGSA